MSRKKDTRQLELDLETAAKKVKVLTAAVMEAQTALQVAEKERKHIWANLILARMEEAQHEPGITSLRKRIRRNVVGYCLTEGIPIKDAWTLLYKELKKKTGINPYDISLTSKESKLARIEEAGLLDELFGLLPCIKTLAGTSGPIEHHNTTRNEY